MAMGSARMFNIKLPKNFESPYKASSIIDFWRRWNQTLSRFLRDHLYIPLGGNRKGYTIKHVNVMTTMLLGGLWHGAGWSFVIWGGIHGVLLVINQEWVRFSKRFLSREKIIPRPVGILITFFFVVVAWVFFRATSYDGAIIILKGMAGFSGLDIQQAQISLFSLLTERLVEMSPPEWVLFFMGNGVPLDDASPLLGVFGDPIGLIWLALLFLMVLVRPNTMDFIEPREGQIIAFKLNIIWLFLLAPLAGYTLINLVYRLNQVRDFIYFNF